jgi:hypothetical protein
MPSELALHATERSTIGIRAQFTDEAGVAVVPTTLTWTLTDGNGAVVNSRSAVAITPAATVLFVLTNLDLSLASPLSSTTRYLLVEGTYNSSLGTGLALRDQVAFDIDDLVKVTG